MRKRLTPKQQADATAATNRKLKAFGAMVCDPRLNGTDIRVAWRIIYRMNPKCRSHPGHKLISEELSLTRQTVARSTARLEGFGCFDIAKGGGRGKSHTYTLKRETVRDDGHHEKRPRNAKSVRGLKQYCPSPRIKGVRDDGQEPIKESIRELIKGGRAASPPNAGGASLKKKECLQGEAVESATPQISRSRFSGGVVSESNKAVHAKAVKAATERLRLKSKLPESLNGGVSAPARIKPCLDALQAEGFTPDAALVQLKVANRAAA